METEEQEQFFDARDWEKGVTELRSKTSKKLEEKVTDVRGVFGCLKLKGVKS